MLRLSEEQYQALREDAYRRWHLRLMLWLRENAKPARAMTDADLMAIIARQEQRAAAHGIETERALARWTYLAIMTDETFDHEPGVKSVLSDPGRGRPAERMAAIFKSYLESSGRTGR